MGNVRGGTFPDQRLLIIAQTDPLSPWPYPYNRATKDGSVLRSTSETEGHSCVRGRNHTYTPTMAISGLPNRIVWDFSAIW